MSARGNTNNAPAPAPYRPYVPGLTGHRRGVSQSHGHAGSSCPGMQTELCPNRPYVPGRHPLNQDVPNVGAVDRMVAEGRFFFHHLSRVPPFPRRCLGCKRRTTGDCLGKRGGVGDIPVANRRHLPRAAVCAMRARFLGPALLEDDTSRPEWGACTRPHHVPPAGRAPGLAQHCRRPRLAADCPVQRE